MYFQAYDNQSYNNYNWVFNDSEAPLNPSKWQMDYFNSITNIGQSSSTSRPALTSENGATFQAVLRKVCNLSFSSAGGYVYVNGYLYSSPKEIQVVEQNSATADGQWYYSNYIEYTFSHWTSGGQTYSSPFTATENKTYTAVYVGKPTNSGEYAGAGGIVGQPIVVT